MTVRTDIILAVAWHDPPWKPWGMMLEDSAGKQLRVTGYERYRVHTKIKYALKKLKKELCSKSRDKYPYIYVNPRVIEDALERFNNLQKRSWGAKKHEIQALLIPALLSATLYHAGCNRLAQLVYDAGEHIARACTYVKQTDVLASAVDRYILDAVARLRRGERAQSRVCATTAEFKLVNPFNPEIELKIPEEISADAIAAFLVNYAEAVTVTVKKGGCSERLLRDAAVLLLEPVWYATVGEEYVPPAETRVPTHTVFDHVNAALAVLNWVYHGNDGAPSGQLVVVDLAGVQGWIQESRRLRDLWAASWLASLLAWKAVEELVDEYGPGVLVQPPARLHPFLAAKVAGRAGDPELTLRIPGGGWTKVRLSQLLGLPLRWPVDPTVPARVVLALPPMEQGEPERRVKDALRCAWREVVEKTVASYKVMEELSKAFSASSGQPSFVAPEELAGFLEQLASKLEPPLAARILYYEVNEAYDNALDKIANKVLKDLKSSSDTTNIAISLKEEDLAKAVFYQIALRGAFNKKLLRLKAPGRRLGPGYAWYASQAYERGWGAKLCSVCGKAPAMIDGDALPVEGSWLSVEVGGDRLCPYCAVKRLLRRALLEWHADKALTHLKVSGEARKKLRFATVDSFTSRTAYRLNDVLNTVKTKCEGRKDMMEKVMAALRGVAGGGRERRGARQAVSAIRAHNTSPHAGGEYDASLVSLVIEALHDELVVRALREAGEREECARVIAEAAARARDKRAVYALVAADSDFATLVILGRLGLDPRSYAERVINVAEESVKEKVVTVYEGLARALGGEEDCKDGGGRGCEGAAEELKCEPPSALATPSYAFSVSRSLAAAAAIDREIVDNNFGMVVYAGGDDMLAVATPAKPGDGGEAVFPALRMAAESRLAYWGRHPRYRHSVCKGFNVLRHRNGRGGEEVFAIAVSPALAAYGKSLAVMGVHSRTPMWFSLETVRAAEDAKKGSVRLRLSPASSKCEEPPCKDVLFLGSEAVGVAVIPWTLPEDSGAQGYGGGWLHAESIRDSLEGLASLTLQRKGLSPSALHEIISENTVNLLLLLLERRATDTATQLIASILARHSNNKETAEDALKHATLHLDEEALRLGARLGSRRVAVPIPRREAPLTVWAAAAALAMRTWL